jgi:hypothetical protein
MRLVQLAIVGLVAAAVGGRYWREHSRLRTVEKLGGPEGLRYLEATRGRSDRVLPIVTALFVAGAIASVVYFVAGR